MKSSAPWSVKGIERDARATAKEAAKREGMTVGEWLNQIIYRSGAPDESDGEIEGLKLRDVVTAIEHLNKRTAEIEGKNVDALGEMTRNIGRMVERVQRLERVKPSEGSNQDLAARLEKLETAGGERQRIDALKALEKAVSLIAAQFNNSQKTSLQRLDENERHLKELSARIESASMGDDNAAGNSFLKKAIEELTARITRAEHIASEAAELKAQASGSANTTFVERTGERLRVLGDEIKRGEDQIRSFELTITKLSAQIDAAERRSAEGVQKITDEVSELRDQLSAENAQSLVPVDCAIIDAKISQNDEAETSSFESLADEITTHLESSQKNTTDDTAVTDAEPTETEGMLGDLNVTPIEALGFEFDENEETVPTANLQFIGGTPITDDEDYTQSADDEIEAAFEDAPESSEDFSFDLDDSEPEESKTAKSLLSDVQNVFSGLTSSVDAQDLPEATGIASEDNDATVDEISSSTIENDLDAILHNLGDMSTKHNQDEHSSNTDTDNGRGGTKALLFGGAPSISKPPSTDETTEFPLDDPRAEDFLKEARRRAEESTEQAGSTKPTRRKLTPKQRAILAARVRQKRLSEGQNITLPETETIFPPVADEIPQPKSDLDKAVDETAETADDNTNPELETENNATLLTTLKSTVTARPVTWALGIAIFFAAAALFYLVSDLVTKSPDAPAPRTAPSVAANPASTTAPMNRDAENSATGPSTTDELSTGQAAVPSLPTIDPRTLYLESMAALNNATGEAETTNAIGTLEQAAALGHPPAQLQLGELYKIGQGVEQDLGQARTWFRRSANGGNVLAMHRIGVMTARGDGGPADTREAIGWFELAANRGLIDSQYNLGAIYHPTNSGSATSIQDASKAYFWYSLAANNGDDQAAPLASSVSGALTLQQVNKLDAEITAWTALPTDADANEMTAISN